MKPLIGVTALLVLLSACGRHEAPTPALPPHCDRSRMYKPIHRNEVQELVTGALLQGGALRTIDDKTVASRLNTCLFALNFEIIRARDVEPTPDQRRRFVSGSPAALFMRRALLSGRDDAFPAAQMDCYVYLFRQIAADRRSCQAFLDPKATPDELNEDAALTTGKALGRIIPPMPKDWHPSPETGAVDDIR